MSAPTQPRPSSIFLAFLATITYIACVVSAWGLLSYFLDRSPISNPHAGPLVGPIMVFAAATTTFLSLRALKTMRSPVGRAAVAVATSYLAMIVVVFIGASIVVAEVAAGPFLITAALLSGVTVIAVWRYEHPKRPPWRDPRLRDLGE